MIRDIIVLAASSLLATSSTVLGQSAASSLAGLDTAQTHFRSVSIDGVKIFYREAGPSDALAVLLLHGFPASSHMFRDLIPRLADKYRVVAPDYPGFGYSDSPERAEFAYTFDNYAGLIKKFTEWVGLDRYVLYVMDYGAPVGFRVATGAPDKVSALIVQNGNAYDEGMTDLWDPIRAFWNTGSNADRESLRWQTSLKATQWQYTDGVKDVSLVSPDAWTLDQALLDRPGNQEIQLDLIYDYRTNPPLYPKWQSYFRERQPPTLVVWGQNDKIFVSAGVAPYKRDNPTAEIHMLDTGHFALETHGPHIARLIHHFLDRNVASAGPASRQWPIKE
jgi:pimeloyl-ACP methyl ester carboxylesterase